MAQYRSPEYHSTGETELEKNKANILIKTHDDYINP